MPLPRTSGQATAYLIWCGAWYTTARLCLELGASLAVGAVLGLAIQAAATKLESPWWRGRRSSLSAGIIVLDMLINAGGVWPWVSRLNTTTVWRMLLDVTHLDGGLSALPAFLLALIIGYVLAAAPEKAWNA